MSTIQSQSGPLDRHRREQNPEVQLTGIRESLGTPGLAITQDEPSETARSLLRSFASLGGASSQIVYQQHLDEAKAKEQARIEADHAHEIAVADTGRANIDAGSDLPKILSSINDGSLRPNEGESVADFSKRLAVEGADDQSDAYRDRRLAVLSNDIAAATQARVDRNVREARDENATLAVQAIDGATDGATFNETVAAIRALNPDISDEAASAEVGLRALKYAVSAKDTKALAAAKSFLGDRLKTEQQIAQNQYDAAVDSDRTQSLQDLRDQVGKMLDEGSPFSTVRQFIAERGNALGINVHSLNREVGVEERVTNNERDAAIADERRNKAIVEGDTQDELADTVAGKILSGDFESAGKTARGAGDVSKKFVLGLVDQVDAHEARALRDSNEQVKAQAKLAFTNQAAAGASALADAGLANMISDAVDPVSGEKITANELRTQAMTERFRKLADTYKDDPERAIGAQIKAASDNAYFPGAWKQLIDGSGQKITAASIAGSKDGTISGANLRGYEFFKRLTAQSPGLLDSMSLSSRTRELFSIATELEKTPLVGSDPTTALTTAASIVDEPGSALDSGQFTAIRNLLDIETQRDREIAVDAAPLAKIFTRLGKTPEDAVSQAIKQVSASRLKINGWSARLGNVPPAMRHQFVDVAEDKIAAYAETLKDTGYDKSDLAFRYDSSNDLWQIVQRDTGVAVPTDNPDATFFSTRELIESARKKNEADAIRKYHLRQRNKSTIGIPVLSIFDHVAPP